MTTVKGVYENGQIRLLEKVAFAKPQKILITFLDEEVLSEDETIRLISLQQPNSFLEEYLSDEREDLYQEYAKKIPK